MPSPPCIDIDGLLAPIPGDLPAGPSVPFTLRQKLEEARKEIRLEDFAPNDPMRPETAKVADWAGIIRLTSDCLTSTSKDLLVTARLVEALVKERAFGGLRDGFRLQHRLLKECWDRINPTIEDGDLDVRAAPFAWLDDPERGARFPSTLRAVPLVVTEEHVFSWLEWKRTLEGGDEEGRKRFEKAANSVPRPRCQALVDDIVEACNELETLKKTLEERLGEAAPALLEVSKALGDCRLLAEQILARKGPAPFEAPPVEESASASEDTPAQQGNSSKRSMSTREEVYEQLATAAMVLQQIEPHSPIPYLIQRAVELGKLPFPQLIRVLLRDNGKIIEELNRELGIKDEGSA